MYTFDDVRDRCRVIFNSAVARHKKKLEKSAGKGVKLQIASSKVLPYSFDEFLNWTWKRYGTKPFPCPYCPRIIDFRTMQMDHRIPVKRNGSLGLDNQDGICEHCNQLKGEQTPEEFAALLAFLATCSPQHRTYLEQRIRGGAVANRLRFFNHRKKQDQPGAPSPKSAIQQTFKLE